LPLSSALTVLSMNLDPNKISSSQPPQAEPPRMGGIPFGPTLAGALYLLLVGSAALALWVRRSPAGLPVGLGLAAPWAFLVFVVAFALYRLGLVRAGRYPAFRAFFQVGVAILFFTLLLPSSQVRYMPEGELEALMLDANPRVRALAAEVARTRTDRTQYAKALVHALEDPEVSVRTQAHHSLVVITGQDLGSPEDPKGVANWRERYP